MDCHDEYEQLTAFQTAFENDATFPSSGTVVGEGVEVLSVAGQDERHELIATCQRNGHRYEIALLDIDINADPGTTPHASSRHTNAGSAPERLRLFA